MVPDVTRLVSILSLSWAFLPRSSSNYALGLVLKQLTEMDSFGTRCRYVSVCMCVCVCQFVCVCASQWEWECLCVCL